jgi:Beta-lactamase
MKRFVVLFAVLVFVVHLPAAAPPALDAKGNAAIGAFVTEAVARGDVPGAVVLVTGPDRVLYHEAFGKMNDAKNVGMQKDAIFNIASMTKAVTSVGTMMLVEEGKLGLDDEVSKYLPAYKSRHVISKVDIAASTYETRPATRPITIRQLLTHTSGIGYSWSDPGLALVQKKTGAAQPISICRWSMNPEHSGRTAPVRESSAKSSRRSQGSESTHTSRPGFLAHWGCATQPTPFRPPRRLASSHGTKKRMGRLLRSRIPTRFRRRFAATEGCIRQRPTTHSSFKCS